MDSSFVVIVVHSLQRIQVLPGNLDLDQDVLVVPWLPYQQIRSTVATIKLVNAASDGSKGVDNSSLIGVPSLCSSSHYPLLVGCRQQK